MPQDPASGAARSMRTVCEMLAGAGWTVRVLATTATERAKTTGTMAYFEGLGIDVVMNREVGWQAEFRFTHRGVQYVLLDGKPSFFPGQFDYMFDRAVLEFSPDILLAYGGKPEDRRRYERAREVGVKTVFALRNGAYQTPGFFDHFDGVLTPSRFLTDLYRTTMGIESTPLPVPLNLEDVVAEERDPHFVTMVNPSPEKGLMVMARIAEELGRRRPDIPVLIVEARGTVDDLVQAGLLGGFDLRRHKNIVGLPAVAQPKHFYAKTRVLVAPSLWQEPAGRVAAEALLNGIPPIVSDRGGLGEVCNGAGFVLHIPEEFTPKTREPLPAEAVEPWVELIARLWDDQTFYEAEAVRALAASDMYRPENLTPRYLDYFMRVWSVSYRLAADSELQAVAQ
jgi:glycosyltransferase involved in cell wall biosynthesis